MENCDGQLRDGQLRDLYRSRGKAHRLAVTLGMARKKSRQATAENCDVAQDMKLRVVSVGFSCWSRGRRSAANRAQQLACTRFCFLSFGWLFLLVFLPLARTVFVLTRAFLCRDFFSDVPVADGVTIPFQQRVDQHLSAQRLRQLAAVSHFRAQKPGLLSFLSERPIQHTVYTRVADDTNLWLKPQEVADEEDADHDQRETGRFAKSGSNKKNAIS